jgi:hypothetical protein
MQQQVFIVKEHYKSENSLVRIQRKFCTEFALRKGPTKIPFGILLSSFMKWVAYSISWKSCWTPIHSTADVVDEARQTLLRNPKKSLRPLSQQINMSCSTARRIYWSVLSEYPCKVQLYGWLSSGLLRRVIWWKFTDVSEVFAAIIALMMEALC